MIFNYRLLYISLLPPGPWERKRDQLSVAKHIIRRLEILRWCVCVGKGNKDGSEEITTPPTNTNTKINMSDSPANTFLKFWTVLLLPTKLDGVYAMFAYILRFCLPVNITLPKVFFKDFHQNFQVFKKITQLQMTASKFHLESL